MSDQLDSKVVLAAIAQGAERESGECFFSLLAKQIVETFEVKCVVITRLSTKLDGHIETIAVWVGDQKLENFSFPIRDTPCEVSIGGDPVFFPDGVCKIFPNAEVIRNLEAESYASMPMFSDGNVIGHIAVIDDKPRDQIPIEVPALKVYADRASVELNQLLLLEEAERNALRMGVLLGSMPVVFSAIDANWKIEIFEGSLIEELGLKKTDFIGHDFRELFASESDLLEAVEGAMSGVVSGPVRHKVGSHILDTHISLIREDSAVRVSMVCIDVTKHVFADNVLARILEGTIARVGDEYFASLVKIIAESLDVSHVFINECLDFPVSEVQTLAVWIDGKCHDNFKYATDITTPCGYVVNGKEAFWESGIQDHFPEDQELVDMNAEAYWGLPLRDTDGNILGTLVILSRKPLDPAVQTLPAIRLFAERAASELVRQRADKVIRESEEQLRIILDDHVDGVVVVAGGQILRANHRFADLIGWAADAVVGEKISRWLNIDADRGQALIERADGDMPVEWEARKVRYQMAEASLIVVRDISHRQKTEEDLDRLRSNLAHVGRLSMMGEMTSGIAHEINQPLTAIANYTSALRAELMSGEVPENIHESLLRIEDQAIRAGGIIRGLRNLARNVGPQRVQIDLNELIRELLQLLEPDARANLVSVSLKLDENLPQLKADRVQLQQVVMNLARNAIDSLKQKEGERVVEINTVAVDDSRIRICVSDNGQGIPKSLSDQMFEPFNTSKPEGLGLGLAICRSIVEAHNGKIWVESSEHGGASVAVELAIP